MHIKNRLKIDLSIEKSTKFIINNKLKSEFCFILNQTKYDNPEWTKFEMIK